MSTVLRFPAVEIEECPGCRGEGRLMVEYESGTGYTSFVDCGECNGWGEKLKTEIGAMPTTVEQEVMCPKCGGKTWDNRLSKKNPKAPDYKCRNKSCDGVVWPPRERDVPTAKPAYNQTAKQPISHGAPGPFDDQEADERAFVKRVQQTESVEWVAIREKYVETLQWVVEELEPRIAHVAPPTVAELLSATATLFIERNRKGV